MIVSEFIEWLKTMPQDAKVEVLEHYNNAGYYQQGGTCYQVDFTPEVDLIQWKDEGDTSPVEYIYGKHFQMDRNKDGYTLAIGVKDK
jgi:hypothetical protein